MRGPRRREENTLRARMAGAKLAAASAFIRSQANREGIALCTNMAIAKSVGCDRSYAHDVVRKLVERGEIEVIGKRAYRVAPRDAPIDTVTRLMPNTTSTNTDVAMVAVSLPRIRWLEHDA